MKDTGLRGFNVVRILFGVFALILGFVAMILSFVADASVGGLTFTGCSIGLGAFIMSNVAARAHKRVLIGHIITSVFAQIFFIVSVALLASEYDSVADAAFGMLITELVLMAHNVFFSILTLAIPSAPKTVPVPAYVEAAPVTERPAPLEQLTPAAEPVYSAPVYIEQPVVPVQRSASEKATDLLNVKALLDAGVITQAEYEAMRAEIMGN